MKDHPGIRPSILTSQPTISTGSMDVDKILGHRGVPLGCSVLIEENGTTDFSTVLLKKFVSEGLVQNRLDKLNTHIIIIGQDSSWGKSLPGLYKGSSRDQKRLLIKMNESKLSVSNINDQTTPNKDMKIAWRYGLLDRDSKAKGEDDLSLTTHPDFIHQFDITSTMIPAPNPTEMSFVPISKHLVKQVELIIQKYPGKVIRLVIPNLLHPLIYPLQMTKNLEILKMILSLRNLTRKYSSQLAMMVSLNLDLYSRENALVTLIEHQFDGVLELQPFNPELYELMERVYLKEPKKIKHGFVNILKLPGLSDLGMMVIKNMEYCFKNGKKNFDVEEWSIPVDEETGVDRDEVSHDGAPPKGQTLKNIEF